MRTSWSLTVLLVMLPAFAASAPAVAAPATHFALSFPLGVSQAGTQTIVAVNPQDEAGVTDTAFTGTVHFTSSDPLATLPPDTPIHGGTSVMVTFGVSGGQTLSATLTGGSIRGGTTLTVNPGPAQRLTLGFPTLVTGGLPFMFTVTARDAFGNRVQTYSGNVRFTSSDPDAALPADATVTTPATNFTATLRSSGVQTITATDPSFAPVFAAPATIFVAQRATRLQVIGPASTIAGLPGLVGVRALDAAGALAASFGGTIHFTSSDALAKLPADVKLVNGQATELATFDTPGRQTIAAAVTTSPGIAGTSDPVAVGFLPPVPQPGGPSAPPAAAPVIRGLAVRPLCVRKAKLLSAPKRGKGKLALSFALSAGARVSVSVGRLVKAAVPARCPRRAGSVKGAVKLVRTLSGSAVGGANALAVAAGVGRGALPRVGALPRAGMGRGARAGAGRRTIPLAGSAAAAKALAPGAYVVQVRATDAAGRRSALATAKFFVLR
jgi:hypothetical protein